MFMSGEGCADESDGMAPFGVVESKIMNTDHNRRASRIKAAAVAVLLLALAACASPFKADVSRFQSQLPPPSGQTFTVVPKDEALRASIEFGYYARFVEQQMIAQGFQLAPTPEQATLLVNLDYGVDQGRERIRSWGGSMYGGWGNPWGPWGWGGAGFRRGWGGPWGYGWYDPWMDSGRVESYTVFTSGINMTIDRRADGQRLFEGRAQAVSTSNKLQHLVPNLVQAMFTGFPGNSGETVRITIAPEDKKTASAAPGY